MLIQRTKKRVPVRMVVYGADGVGKSSFCAGADGAVFIPVEEGLDNIDTLATERPATWDALVSLVDELAKTDTCKSIVIDSIDEAEQLCWAHACLVGDDKGAKKDIEAFGYGKGYVAALSYWRELLAALERANAAGKNVLLIAHAHRKSVRNPMGEDFEQWQIKLQDKASSLFREWSHIVAFAELDIATVTNKDGLRARTKGTFSGKRILRALPSAGYQGKTRVPLPRSIPLDWLSFNAALEAALGETSEQLESKLSAAKAALGNDDVSSACDTFLAQRGRTDASLREAIGTVNEYITQKETA